MTTSSKLMVQEARHLVVRVKAVVKERGALRYEQKMFHLRIEKEIALMLELRKTWDPSKPTNPYMAKAAALNDLLAKP